MIELGLELLIPNTQCLILTLYTVAPTHIIGHQHVLPSHIPCSSCRLRPNPDAHKPYVPKLPHLLSTQLLTTARTRIAKPYLWVIEMHNGADNRLTLTMIEGALQPALDIVEKEWREKWRGAQSVKGKDGAKGALIIVGKRNQEKFFSNGALLFLQGKRSVLTANQVSILKASKQTRIGSTVRNLQSHTLHV